MSHVVGAFCAILALPLLCLAGYIWLDQEESFSRFYTIPLIFSSPFLIISALCFAFG